MQPSTRGNQAHVSRETVQAAQGGGLSMFYAFPDRDPGDRPWNRSPSFNSHARNKRSMSIDIMQPEGEEMFRRLIAVSDVLVENNVPETIERAHATYEELSKINPELIMLRMPGYGLSGPYKNYRTLGTHMEGMTGHHYIRGYQDMDPSNDRRKPIQGRRSWRKWRFRRDDGLEKPPTHWQGAADRNGTLGGLHTLYGRGHSGLHHERQGNRATG